MKKIKFKTKSAFAKRFSVTGGGKIKRDHACTSHLFGSKTTKQKRHLRKGSYLSIADHKRSKVMIGPGSKKNL